MDDAADIFSWWEDLKDRIRKSTIAYCKKRMWKAREAERDVRAILGREASLLEGDPDRDATVYAAALDRLKRFQVEKSRAAALRARVRDYVEGEWSSAFFLGLEKKRQEKTVIRSLYDAKGNLCTEIEDMLETVEVFYKDLFSGSGCDKDAIETCVESLSTQVGEEDRAACDADITVDEIRQAIARQE